MKLEYVKRLIVCRTRNKNYHFLPLIRNRCCGKSRLGKYVAGDQIYGSRPFRKPISEELKVKFSLHTESKKYEIYFLYLSPVAYVKNALSNKFSRFWLLCASNKNDKYQPYNFENTDSYCLWNILKSIILGRRKVLKNLESIHHERALRSVGVDAYFVNSDHHQILFLVQLQVAWL